MELRQYLGILWKWLWLIVIAVVIASGSSYFASQRVTPLFKTKTTLMVGQLIQSTDPNAAQFYSAQQLAATYAQLATREPVLKGVVDSLGWDVSWSSLLWQINAYAVPQTQLIEIQIIDSDPYRAKVLADTLAQQLILISPSGISGVDQEQQQFTLDQLSDLKGKITTAQSEVDRLKVELDAANSARLIQDLQNQIDIQEMKISGWQQTYANLLATVEGGEVNALNVIEEAAVPRAPFSPDTTMNVLLAAVIGLVLAVGGVFVIEYFDDTVRGSEDVIKATGVRVLGKIGRIKGKDYYEKLIAIHQPESREVEAFRGIAVNILHLVKSGRLKCILVTSPGPREGKSMIIANTAVVLAQAGMRVILVDADVRKPRLHLFFGLPNETGLRDILLQSNPEVKKYIQPTRVDCLSVLTSGPSTSNPSLWLGSSDMNNIVNELKTIADVILFDSPPFLVVSDAGTLASIVDSILLVVDTGHTRISDVKRVVEDFQLAHKNIRGIIVNRVKGGGRSYHYYQYYSENMLEKNSDKQDNHRNIFEQEVLEFRPEPPSPLLKKDPPK